MAQTDRIEGTGLADLAALAALRSFLRRYLAGIYVLGVTAGAAALPFAAGGLGLHGDAPHSSRPLIALLAVLLVVAERVRTDLFGESKVTLTFVPLVAATLLLTAQEAAVIAGASSFVAYLVLARLRLRQALFNAATVSITAFAGSAVFELFGGELTSSRLLLQLAVALGAGCAMYFVNTGIVAGVVAIVQHRDVRTVWTEKFRWLLPHFLAFTAAGYAMAQAYVALGLLGASIFALPVLALWVAIRQYSSRARADVMRLQRANESLERSERRFRSLVQRAPGLVAVLNPDGTMQELAPGGDVRRSRLSPATFVHPADMDRLSNALGDVAARSGAVVELSLRIKRDERGWREHDVTLTNLVDEAGVQGIVLNAHDVADQKALEEQLRHQAFHDPLTRLPNRALFADRLAYALGVRRPGAVLAVMFIDLDRFKTVNDTFGHHFGDKVLVAIAERLSRALGRSETLSRFGGDEFTLLVPELTSGAEATAMASALLHVIEEPVVIEGQDIHVTGSIGVALASDARRQPDELVRNADVALFSAKKQGRNRWVVYDRSLDTYSLDRFELEADLRQAVERGELRLHYQPEVDLATERIVGFEALVRWEHPQRGRVPPDQFIPLAEEIGEIVEIGRWVLAEACRQGARWQRELGMDLTIGVNLSAPEFFEPGMTEHVARVLEQTGFDPRLLRIEITESVLVDSAAADRVFGDLRALGVQLAIDDFGTGYSSFSYLRRLPADALKVDRSFIANLEREERDGSIVRAIVGVAGALGMHVVAEGVEREAQRDLVRSLGCERAQGYLWSKPLPADEAAALLAGSRLAVSA